MIFKKIERHNIVAITGVTSKLIYAFFFLVNTRLLVDILGVKGFAAISIILSFIPWFMLLNFGIPSAIQNKISEYRANKKNYRILLSNLEALMIGLILLSFILSGLLSIIIGNYVFSDYEFVEIKYLFLIFIILSFYALSEIYSKVLFAEHRGYIPNLFPMFISLFGFIILIICKKLNISDFNLITTLFLSPYLITFFFAKYKSGLLNIKPNVNFLILRDIFKLSKNFWIFAFLANLTLGLDYVIMSKLIEPKDIAIYNVNFRVFSLYLVLYSTFLFALWPVIAELYHQKKMKDIKDKFHKILLLGIVSLVIGAGLFILTKDLIFQLLTGKKELKPTLITMILISTYFLLRIWTDTYAMVLQSMNKTHILLYVVPIQALISVSSQIILAKVLGLNGIILGLILSFILTVAWILPYFVYKFLRPD